MINIFRKRKTPVQKFMPLQYMFVNNSILLTTDTIVRNGYHVIWNQQNGDGQQILTFNEQSQDFKAFDKFIYMDDKAWYLDRKICDMIIDDTGIDELGFVKFYKQGKELWTPIEFKNMTTEQLRFIFNPSNS